MSSNRISSHLERSAVTGSGVKNLHKQYYSLQSVDDQQLKNEETQTDVRDDECQTVPWESHFRISSRGDAAGAPEALAVANFINASELPICSRQIHMINRLRMKRAWKQMMPASVKTRSALISELDSDEWADRDAEIQLLMDLRMRSAEKAMRARERESKAKVDARFARVDERLHGRKQQQLQSIEIRFVRELRKLAQRRSDKRSGMRNDATFACYDRRVQINSSCCSSGVLGAESKEDAESEYALWLFSRTSCVVMPAPAAASANTCRSKSKEIDAGRSNLLLERSSREAADPMMEEKDSRPYEELIEQFRAKASTTCSWDNQTSLGRQLRQQQHYSADSAETPRLQPQMSDAGTMSSRLREILQALRGKTVAKALTMLANKVDELQSEKNAQRLALLAERERLGRDVEASGEQRLELDRRRQLDQVFRQLLQVNQESAQSCLDQVLSEGVERASRVKAGVIAQQSVSRDEQSMLLQRSDEEGYIADVMYSFVLPHVDKQLLQTESQVDLRAAHRLSFQQLADLQKLGRDQTDCSREISSSSDNDGYCANQDECDATIT